MKICLVAEGSYPYVSGGVSSWIQQLIRNMPEHEFTLISVSASKNDTGEMKYTPPDNLLAITAVCMDQLLHFSAKRTRDISLSKEERDLLGTLLRTEVNDWSAVFNLFHNLRLKQTETTQLFSSKAVFQLLEEVYEEQYKDQAFTDVYWNLRSMYLPLFSLLLEEYPYADIYHSVSTGYAGIIAATASYQHGSGFVLTEHGIYTREREEEIIKSQWLKGSFKSSWINYFCCLSSAAYACTHQVVSLFQRNKEIQCDLGCDADKIRVIHNGVRVEDFESVRRYVTDRNHREDLNVGAVVRVVPIKDIKTMLKAFAYASKKLPRLHFWIMGPTDEDPEYYEECLQYKAFLHLNNVTFTGYVNLREYLGKMDLLVLTSISEGQPLAILEGMACSLPFVSTNVGDCAALVQGSTDPYGPAGKVACVMDYADIGNGIVELCSDHRKRRLFGENGYTRIREKYTADAFINGYKSLYQQVEEGMKSGRYRV